AGAGIGVGLNLWASRLGTLEDPQLVKLEKLDLLVHDSTDRATIVIQRPGQEHRYLIDPEPGSQTAKALRAEGFTVVPSAAALKERDPGAFQLFQQHGRSTARRVGELARAIGGLFLRMLMMVSVPLIVTSLITGVTGLGSAQELGRMFGRTA